MAGEVCDVMATLDTAGRSCMASARSGGRSSTMSAAPLSMSCAWRAGVALRMMTSLNSGRSPAQFGFGLSVIDRPGSTPSMTYGPEPAELDVSHVVAASPGLMDPPLALTTSALRMPKAGLASRAGRAKFVSGEVTVRVRLSTFVRLIGPRSWAAAPPRPRARESV